MSGYYTDDVHGRHEYFDLGSFTPSGDREPRIRA